jgi:hypothetical protein
MYLHTQSYIIVVHTSSLFAAIILLVWSTHIENNYIWQNAVVQSEKCIAEITFTVGYPFPFRNTCRSL